MRDLGVELLAYALSKQEAMPVWLFASQNADQIHRWVVSHQALKQEEESRREDPDDVLSVSGRRLRRIAPMDQRRHRRRSSDPSVVLRQIVIENALQSASAEMGPILNGDITSDEDVEFVDEALGAVVEESDDDEAPVLNDDQLESKHEDSSGDDEGSDLDINKIDV